MVNKTTATCAFSPSQQGPGTLQSNTINTLQSLIDKVVNSPNTAAQSIANLRREELTLLTQPISRKRINLLIIALVRGHVSVAQAISELLTDEQWTTLFKQKDCNGWTVLHHAAVTDTAFYKKLKQKTGATEVATPYATSPGLLRKLCGLAKNNFLDQDCKILFGNEKEEKWLSGAELIKEHAQAFSSLPHHFTHIPCMDRATLYKMWNASSRENESCAASQQKYIHYMQKFKLNQGKHPHLSIRKVTKDDGAKDIQTSLGMGLYCSKPIQKGQVICFYGGKIVSPLKALNSYLMDLDLPYMADALTHRSCGSLANHSFPNAFLTSTHINGIELPLLIALDDIAEGDQICINYSSAYFRTKMTLIELRPNAMMRFVKQHPLKDLWSIWAKTAGTAEDYLLWCWEYILWEFPGNFLKLILNSSIPIEDAKWIFEVFEKLSQLQNVNLKEISFNWNDQIVHGDVLLPIFTTFKQNADLSVLQECLYLRENHPEDAKTLASYPLPTLKADFLPLMTKAGITKTSPQFFTKSMQG